MDARRFIKLTLFLKVLLRKNAPKHDADLVYCLYKFMNFSQYPQRSPKRFSVKRNPFLYKFVAPFAVVMIVAGFTAHRHQAKIAAKTSTVKDDQVIAADAGVIDAEGKKAEDAIAIPVVENKQKIFSYTVTDGDTLSSVAQMFDVSVNTIRWANDLTSKSKIHAGDVLTILPVDGIQYVVKRGDTVSGIAKRFGADQQEIIDSNNLENAQSIKIGMELVIPNAEPNISNGKKAEKNIDQRAGKKNKIDDAKKESLKKSAKVSMPDDEDSLDAAAMSPVSQSLSVSQTQPAQAADTAAAKTTETTTGTSPAKAASDDGSALAIPAGTPTVPGSSSAAVQFVPPLPGSHVSQRLHGANAVDFAHPVGGTVLAAASGTVIVAKGRGSYSGGYGNYIVINHSNGVQTLYAHLSAVEVTAGQLVTQGQEIAKSGNTGKTTGPHLHFEVRGAKNPFGRDAVNTQY